MITKNAALTMNLKNHKISVGSKANIVVLQENDIVECIRNHSRPLYVVSNGKILDDGLLSQLH